MRGLEGLGDLYESLRDHPPPNGAWWYSDPGPVLDLLRPWAQDWNLNHRDGSPCRWIVDRAEAHLKKGRTGVETRVREKEYMAISSPLPPPSRLSSNNEQEAARARRLWQPDFCTAAYTHILKAIPGGFETEAEDSAVARCLEILEEAGAHIDKLEPLPWFSLLRFEDGWNPWGERETRCQARKRIEDRFKEELDAYFSRVSDAHTSEYLADEPLKLYTVQNEVFDQLVQRMVPKAKRDPTLSPRTLWELTQPKGSDCATESTIRRRTKKLADILGLKIPRLPSGPRPAL